MVAGGDGGKALHQLHRPPQVVDQDRGGLLKQAGLKRGILNPSHVLQMAGGGDADAQRGVHLVRQPGDRLGDGAVAGQFGLRGAGPAFQIFADHPFRHVADLAAEFAQQLGHQAGRADHHLHEGIAFQLEHAHPRRGHNGGGALVAVDQRHFAETFAGQAEPDLHQIADRVGADHPHRAVQQDVERVGIVALAHQHGAGRQFKHTAARGQRLPLLGREGFEQGDPVEDTGRVVHGETAPKGRCPVSIDHPHVAQRYAICKKSL